MKKIVRLLREHVRNDFDVKLYSSVGIFLGAFVAINYAIDLEDGIIDRSPGYTRLFFYLALYSFTYFTTLALIAFFRKEKFTTKLTSGFWKTALFGLVILSINIGFPYHNQVVQFFGTKNYRWTFGVLNDAVNIFLVAIPVLISARFIEKGIYAGENFGVNRNNLDLKPYFLLLACVLPLVIVASFEQAFQNYYPVYNRYQPYEGSSPKFMYAAIYELVYGLDFFNVELLFRGFMVIGLSQWLGKDAILPMVSTYCVLHFGKPAGECVSSIFGGYLLGVVALYTRNIWGGVIVHMGLAWLMEVVAFLNA